MTQPRVNQLTLNFPGQNNIVPRFGHLYAPNNTLTEIAAAKFLDNYLKTQGAILLATDFIGAVGSNGHQWYKPVFTNGSCQLVVLP
jgi:hypothetical protein